MVIRRLRGHAKPLMRLPVHSSFCSKVATKALMCSVMIELIWVLVQIMSEAHILLTTTLGSDLPDSYRCCNKSRYHNTDSGMDSCRLGRWGHAAAAVASVEIVEIEYQVEGLVYCVHSLALLRNVTGPDWVGSTHKEVRPSQVRWWIFEEEHFPPYLSLFGV